MLSPPGTLNLLRFAHQLLYRPINHTPDEERCTIVNTTRMNNVSMGILSLFSN